MDENMTISLENVNPVIGNAGRGSMQWQGKMRKLYDCELVYFISAKGVYIEGGKEFPLGPGTMLLIKPDTEHTFVMENGFKQMWVHFDFLYREDQKELWDYLRKNYYGRKYLRPDNELFFEKLPHTEWIRAKPVFDAGFPFPEFIRLYDREIIEILLRKLIFEFNKKKTAYQTKCKSILLDIFTEVIQQVSENNDKVVNFAHFKAYEKLISFIEQNYYKKIHMVDLERLTGLTSSYISRIIKGKTTYSAVEYINYYRIRKAKELLAQNDLKSTEIASMVGFENIHYFSEVFKKFVGVSPKEYRKANY